jgi:cell wall-associated NlpC family hydrolase
MIAPWAAAYVGLPYRAQGRTRLGCDCYGLVRLVYAEVFGVPLPSYAAAYDLEQGRAGWPAVADTITLGLAQWHAVDRPAVQIGDGVVFRIAGQPMHMGIIAGTGPVRVLHIEHGINAVLEPLDSTMWNRRILGFYRPLT